MKLIIIAAALAASSSAYAAPEIDRIHKDVTVMARIIEGAFEADKSCKNCDPKISTSYLANQGVVFNVKASTWKSFHMEHEGEGFSFVIPGPAEPEEVRKVEITKMVGDILDDVGLVIDEVGSHIEYSLHDFDDAVVHLNSDTRRALRELNRERRELEYQRREYEIELIHASEKDRKRIEERIQRLEKEISAMEARHAELREELEAVQQQKVAQREARREKAREEAAAQRALVEDIVFRSLCDYGATLKNVPRDEHISLIFDQGRDKKQNVFVIEKDDLNRCTDASALKTAATQYEF